METKLGHLINKQIAIHLLLIFSVYSIFYIYVWLSFNQLDYGLPYFISFFGRKIMPILLLVGFFTISYFGSSSKPEKYLNKMSWVLIITMAILIVYLSLGYMNGTQFETFTGGANWNYIPIFEYGIFMILSFLTLGKRLGHNYYLFMLICLSLFVAGFIYELPVYYKCSSYEPIHYMHALFLAPGIIASFMLPFFLKYNGFKFGKYQAAGLLVYVCYSIALFIFALSPSREAFQFPFDYAFRSTTWYILDGWLPRIPALLFTTSLIYGVKKK